MDPKAVRLANQQLWAAHPELAGRQLTDDPADAALRAEWSRYYKDDAANDANNSFSSKPVGSPQQPCPLNSKCAALADARDKAFLANHTYGEDDTLPAGYRFLDPNTPEGRNALTELGVAPTDLDPPGSSFHAEIFAKEGTEPTQYVVAYRGTRPTDPKDWESNAQQAVGKRSDHYDRAIVLAKTVDDASNGNVSFVGYSLGGGMASAAAVATGGKPATTFNAAGLSAQTVGGYPDEPAPVDAYYVPGEVLSTVQDNRGAVLSVLTMAATAVDLYAGAWVGAFAAGREAAGKPLLPQAYGTRHALPEAPPPGKGFVGRHNPIDKHGLDWVISGIDKQRAELGCP